MNKATSNKANTNAIASDPPRLLSVEDNAETRLLLKHGLGKAYEVTFASDEEEAIEAIEPGRFDALLVDINLTSERSGIGLLHQIRDREAMAGVPAIAVTAYALPGDREELLNEGFDEYVGKPFTGAELREAIGRALAER